MRKPLDVFNYYVTSLPQNHRPEAVQPSHAAEAEARRRLSQGVPGRFAVEHHRDRLARVLRPLRKGHGGGHHV